MGWWRRRKSWLAEEEKELVGAEDREVALEGVRRWRDLVGGFGAMGTLDCSSCCSEWWGHRTVQVVGDRIHSLKRYTPNWESFMRLA